VSEVGATDPLVWDLAAGGFRDTSRVAASDTQMFLDILLTNRAAVLAQVDAFAAELGELRTLLAQEDEQALRAKLSATQRQRATWKAQR
jgi:prephenate dehydrogenase